MKLSRILVAFDGSEISIRALRMSLEMGRALDADIHAVYVVKTADFMRFSGHAGPFEKSDRITQLISEHMAKEGMVREREIAAIAAEYSMPVRIHKKIGDPREEILELARTIHADLIVIGSRGQGGLKKVLLGSVSSFIVQNSQISTVIVR
ncbi:MAG TPA: universal stress protein [Methanoregulaceae archaeon]|nr:universal stress protein [Methanoregulaceae archaeon]